MLRRLMIMHHNTLCITMHCMLYLVTHICTYAIDPAELKMEVQGGASPVMAQRSTSVK
jgi:hypothetical protein